MSLKICDTCRHLPKLSTESPCNECLKSNGDEMWEPVSNETVMPDGK